MIQLCPTLCDPMDCPWNSPDKNTGVGCHFFLQGIFPTRDQTHISCIAGRNMIDDLICKTEIETQRKRPMDSKEERKGWGELRDWDWHVYTIDCCSCSVTKLHLTLGMDCSMPGSSVSTISWSLLKFMFIELVMLSNHLILCHPLLLPIFPSIRVFSNESALHIKWPKYWSFSFSISPSNVYSGLISFRIDWFDLLSVQIDNKWESTVRHRELYSVFCGDPHGKKIQKRGDICIHTANSLCCIAETNTISMLSHFSHVQLRVTLWPVTGQSLLSMRFPQARILEWVAISFSRGSSQPGGQTHISYVSCICRWLFTTGATWEAQHDIVKQLNSNFKKRTTKNNHDPKNLQNMQCHNVHSCWTLPVKNNEH